MANSGLTYVETQVALSLRGVDVNPPEIASLLGMDFEAQFSDRKGDRYVFEGETIERIEGFCIFVSSKEVPRTEPFHKHMSWMLERLEPHRNQLETWKASGWMIRLTMRTLTTAVSGGPLVEPTLMRRIADLGLTTLWQTSSRHVANR